MNKIKKNNIMKRSQEQSNNEHDSILLPNCPPNHNKTSGKEKYKKYKEKINCYICHYYTPKNRPATPTKMAHQYRDGIASQATRWLIYYN